LPRQVGLEASVSFAHAFAVDVSDAKAASWPEDDSDGFRLLVAAHKHGKREAQASNDEKDKANYKANKVAGGQALRC